MTANAVYNERYLKGNIGNEPNLMVKAQIDEQFQNSFIDDKKNKTREEIKSNLNEI